MFTSARGDTVHVGLIRLVPQSCLLALCSLFLWPPSPLAALSMLGARLLFGHSGCWHIGVQVLVHLPSAARPFQFSSLDLIETGNSADCLILC